ncbi:hypothetical protein CVM73_28275 [Bradyrhizobium forestalis]|uniref:Uncharacterized protein n=1 Tax=Bradyrhizobium forestalis TaxID=1419263 RepID=A0A2M8R243_9BRAD|nr:hypothetical protein CVM73_28275 [Bradyrhizobium forestalis]
MLLDPTQLASFEAPLNITKRQALKFGIFLESDPSIFTLDLPHSKISFRKCLGSLEPSGLGCLESKIAKSTHSKRVGDIGSSNMLG